MGDDPVLGEATSTARLKSGADRRNLDGSCRARRDLRPTIIRPTIVPDHHSLHHRSPRHPHKKTRTVFTVRAPIVQSDSLLAVTFLDGYVVSAILVPDLH